MSRYFLALTLPKKVRESLAADRPPKLPGLRLVRPDQMHVTLHFLGDLQRGELEQAKHALTGIKAPRFRLILSGGGTFPEHGQPRIVWAGIEESRPLSELQMRIGECLHEAIDFQSEDRQFTPHVTLARVKPPVTRTQLNDVWEQALIQRELCVERFILYQSVFEEGRSVYRETAAWELNESCSSERD